MATITTINAGDNITDSRTVINQNFDNLNSDKIETSVLDTDSSLAANSDSKIPSQRAVKSYVDAQGGQTYLVPTGSILPYGGSSAPSNFLLCDGSAVSRTTQATLFGIISTAYGAGDGSTTFNLPTSTNKTGHFGASALKLVAASSQYAAKSNPTGLGITTDISCTAWVYMTSAPSGTDFRLIIGRRGSSAGQESYYFSYENNGGTPGLRAALSSNGTATVEFQIARTLSLNTWYHVAFSYVASTGIMTMYVDGTSIGTASGGPATIHESTGPITVGAQDNGAGGLTANRYWDGYLANIKLFNKALSQTEVYQNMLYINTASCQGSWSFNGVYTDSSANANILSGGNSPTFVALPTMPDCQTCSIIKT